MEVRRVKETSADDLSRCPGCAGVTLRARYGYHPSAKALRNIAALSTGFGFVAFFAIGILGGATGGMNLPGLGF